MKKRNKLLKINKFLLEGLQIFAKFIEVKVKVHKILGYQTNMSHFM